MRAIAHGGVRTPKEILHRKLTLGEKSLAVPGNRTCVSGVTIRCSNQLTYIPSDEKNLTVTLTQNTSNTVLTVVFYAAAADAVAAAVASASASSVAGAAIVRQGLVSYRSGGQLCIVISVLESTAPLSVAPLRYARTRSRIV